MSQGYKQPESVLVVIHTPDLQVLLIERALHPGYWQSVTGSREGTESLRETARRELAEETGLLVEAAALQDWHLANRFEILAQWRHRYAPGVSHNLEHVFSICVPQPSEVRLAPAEHRAQRWLPWQEAASACFSWTNQDAILMLPHRQTSGLET
ncbi:dihydroneopterin triphosphate diphosphatase [Uliginosibacterium aquaticum]|uniref:Dihydroneopterin triphosphate diphosphatase n=1 Tax=Uliginosibacterium aquaticum TaxID=2731212 RepID=A0ABX2IMM6_9RHOO|nr:dihydroneopterin triphosphate diphosphatase [Uliginosibacterium aquaticum]NSL55285.1 dihydroneopterin triphosphate diphosphatase [Uliginosibacterium aquaticum]